MNRKTLLWIAIPILNTLYQIFMKQASLTNNSHNFTAGWCVEAWIIAAVISEILSFIVWMQILSSSNLSKAFPLSGISYILILFTSWYIFQEPITSIEILGGMLILSGVFLIGTTSNKLPTK